MTRRDDRYRVGVDIGGTFMDFVLADSATGRVPSSCRIFTPARGPASIWKSSAFAARYRCAKAHRGHKRAVVAVAHASS